MMWAAISHTGRIDLVHVHVHGNLAAQRYWDKILLHVLPIMQNFNTMYQHELIMPVSRQQGSFQHTYWLTTSRSYLGRVNFQMWNIFNFSTATTTNSSTVGTSNSIQAESATIPQHVICNLDLPWVEDAKLPIFNDLDQYVLAFHVFFMNLSGLWLSVCNLNFCMLLIPSLNHKYHKLLPPISCFAFLFLCGVTRRNHMCNMCGLCLSI